MLAWCSISASWEDSTRYFLIKIFLELDYFLIIIIFGLFCPRHLDNLLLRDDGRLFHVDFGFILGRDPKPFPPPMKLCKEMVEAMGGAERLSLIYPFWDFRYLHCVIFHAVGAHIFFTHFLLFSMKCVLMMRISGLMQQMFRILTFGTS